MTELEHTAATLPAPQVQWSLLTKIVFRFCVLYFFLMSAPNLTRLLEPYGNFSPMGVLWASIGALAATTQVFVLNMTYDVPVKLFAFHLVLMSLVLLAPDVLRVCRAVLHHRAKWRALALQVAAGAYLVWVAMSGAYRSWYGPFGGGAPRPPLYGIWEIDTMTIDGVERAPLVTDYDRWRRVVIQSPTTIAFWRMDDTSYGLGASVDVAANTITISRANNVKNHLAFEQPDADHLIFAGDFGGHAIRMETHLFDRQKFVLVSRGFNWIQELPFNR